MTALSWGTAFPLDWPRIRIKYACRFEGGGTPDKARGEYWNGEIPWVSPKDMKTPFIDDTEDHITQSGLLNSAAKLIEPGAVLIVMRSGILRHSIPTAINRVRVALNQDMRALIPVPLIDARFLARTIEGHQQHLLSAWSKLGSTVESLESDLVAASEIAVPPLPKQRAIADYLDRETARIDALIAAKERVLNLLAEKRRALITRAVTRGLDPTAPIRESGIPWLGAIPTHWRRAQLRRFMQFITSGSRGWAKHYSVSGAFFVRIGNLTRDSVRLDLSDIQYVEPPEGAEGARTRVHFGDVLFSITAYLGSVAFVDQDIGEAYVNQHIALVRLDQSRGLVAQYAAYLALSEIGQKQLVAQSYGGTKTQLALDDVRELWFPIPPVEEQVAIVEFIQASVATLDRLGSVTERTVQLLRERRSALIAAAVTGHIDVEAVA